jgi:hypothetical protein
MVEAGNQAQALRHVVSDVLSVRLAEPADFIKLTRAGIEAEIVKEE